MRYNFFLKKLGQLTLNDEEEQNQNVTDRNTESSQLQTEDTENPWKATAMPPPQQQQQQTNKISSEPAKSSVYVPPTIAREEVRIICLQRNGFLEAWFNYRISRTARKKIYLTYRMKAISQN